MQDRILDAAIALEIMYELESPELTNKLSTRAAHLLAKKAEERIEIFDRVHVFYKARSRIAHGSRASDRRKMNSRMIDSKEASDSGFALASDTLHALLKIRDFRTGRR